MKEPDGCPLPTSPHTTSPRHCRLVAVVQVEMSRELLTVLIGELSGFLPVWLVTVVLKIHSSAQLVDTGGTDAPSPPLHAPNLGPLIASLQWRNLYLAVHTGRNAKTIFMSICINAETQVSHYGETIKSGKKSLPPMSQFSPKYHTGSHNITDWTLHADVP